MVCTVYFNNCPYSESLRTENIFFSIVHGSLCGFACICFYENDILGYLIHFITDKFSNELQPNIVRHN